MDNTLTDEECSELRASVSLTAAMIANPVTCRAINLLLDEREHLKAELEGARNTSSGFETRLREATKAGTPYSVEQDGINALHLRVSDLKNKAESIKKIIHTAKLQIAANETFDADLTLELALRELTN